MCEPEYRVRTPKLQSLHNDTYMCIVQVLAIENILSLRYRDTFRYLLTTYALYRTVGTVPSGSVAIFQKIKVASLARTTSSSSIYELGFVRRTSYTISVSFLRSVMSHTVWKRKFSTHELSYELNQNMNINFIRLKTITKLQMKSYLGLSISSIAEKQGGK